METGRSARDVFDVIERESSADALLLVGHDPHFSEAVFLLAQDSNTPLQGLRTGECAVFEIGGASAPVLQGFLRSDD